MWNNSYLLVPSCVDGNGTGHLRRIIRLYKQLKKNSAVFVYVPIYQISDLYKNILLENIKNDDLIFNILPEKLRWKYIIVDYKESPRNLVNFLENKGFLIGIDEGGTQRGRFDYLIDIIPSPGHSVKANYFSIGLMNLPERRVYKQTLDFNNILITFGGEDYASLTLIFLEFLKENGYFTDSKITVVGKNSFDKSRYKDTIKFYDSITNLKSEIYKYDLVFTIFGLTAFESLASGVPFLLLNPSIYHHKLSEKCNFAEIGIKTPDKKKLDKFLQSGKDFTILQEEFIPEKYTNIGDFILALKNTGSICPVCHYKGKAGNIIYRLQNRNFYKCPECGITYQVLFKELTNSYRRDYFFDDYKNQYGCTYLEDFENIQKISVPRLQIINKLRYVINKKKNKLNLELLDIGCAYGPFLLESKKNGYIPTGIEIIAEAVKYIRSNLDFFVYSGTFETIKLDKKFDIITMWYVIEHFGDLKYVLTKVNKQLKPGGIFAFSTPSSTGISAVKDKRSFFKNSPTDHISVWNPGITPKILKRFGFKVKKIRVTGHHFERFSSIYVFNSKLGYNIINFTSKIFGLGDTFEVYAEKMKELDD